MPCTIIKTDNPLVLFLQIEADEDTNGGINNITSAEIKGHIQKTLLSRHYKKFVWDVKGITKVDSQIIARILMSYEKALYTKCQFFIINMETDFYKMMRIFKLNKILTMKIISESPKMGQLDSFFDKEEISIFDDALIKEITKEMKKQRSSDLGDGILAEIDDDEIRDKSAIRIEDNLIEHIYDDNEDSSKENSDKLYSKFFENEYDPSSIHVEPTHSNTDMDIDTDVVHQNDL